MLTTAPASFGPKALHRHSHHLTDTHAAKGGGNGRDRTGHPSLDGRPSEDPDRGELLLRRAFPNPPRPATAERGHRVVPIASDSRVDRLDQPPPLPPERPVPG